MTTTITRTIEHLRPLLDKHFFHITSPTIPPYIIGISGPQGSGKSYLSSHLSSALSQLYPTLTTIDISTDDFYLTYMDQQRLANEIQPGNWMVSGRGPPATHDLALLDSVLNKVLTRDPGLKVPRYDKGARGGKGDRLPEEKWPCVEGTVDVLIVEGWFNGFKAITEENELVQAWTDVENRTGRKFDGLVTKEDVKYVNEALKRYEHVWDQFEVFVYLSTDSLQNVYDWRLEQEHALKAANGGHGMSDTEVEKFVDRYMPCYELYYEKLNREGCLPSGKNLKLVIDSKRNLLRGDVI